MYPKIELSFLFLGCALKKLSIGAKKLSFRVKFQFIFLNVRITNELKIRQTLDAYFCMQCMTVDLNAKFSDE